MASSKIVFIDLPKAIMKLTFLVVVISLVLTYKWWNEPYFIRFTAPELAASYETVDPNQIKEFAKLLKDYQLVTKGQVEGNYSILLTSHRRTTQYTFDSPKLIYHVETKSFLKPGPSLQNELRLIMAQLKRNSPYGDLLPWPKVKQLISLNTRAKIRDLESGKTFTVIRKSGFNLARVQPVTKNDKETIKSVFGNKWSWKRRAVIVYLGKHRIAACLAGMPQGREQLFSLYFVDKNLNKSTNFANKLVIHKAAGQIRQLFSNSTPEESILGALTALDQIDTETLNHFLVKPVAAGTVEKSGLINLTIRNLYKINHGRYKVIVSESFGGGPYNQWRTVQLKLKYNQKLKYYQLETDCLEPILKSK